MSQSNNATALDLSVSPVHLDTVGEAETPLQVLENFGFDEAAFEGYIQTHCQQGPGRILMIETSTSDWTHWECHEEGDEVVLILEGEGVFIQERAGEACRIPVCAGQAVINRQNVWHTADIGKPLKALYITPCRGTRHKLR